MFIISDNDFTIDTKNINLKPLTDMFQKGNGK